MQEKGLDSLSALLELSVIKGFDKNVHTSFD